MNKRIRRTNVEPTKVDPFKDKPNPKEATFNDQGNAHRLIHYYGDVIRYCPKIGKWYIWRGKRWELDEDQEIVKVAMKVIQKIPEERCMYSEIPQGKYDSHKYYSGFKSHIRGMIELAQPLAAISPELFDLDPWLFNLLNGTYNLEKGELLIHDKKDRITHLSRVRYDSKAKCPMFRRFVHQIMDGDSEIVSYLQRVIGYILTGDTSEQCFFIFYGEGANGKTTLIEIIRALMGSYAQHADIRTFMTTKQSNTPRNDLAAMKGCRFVSTGEAGYGQYLDESLIKQITGGEPIRARFLYNEGFEYFPNFKLVLQTNHIPRIQGNDLGIRRRVRLIPFNVTIPPEKQNPFLIDDLKKELPGILNWALEGCFDWYDNSLSEPNSIKQATEQIFRQPNPVEIFFTECCEFGSHLRVQTSVFKNAYSTWCLQNGVIELNNNKFAVAMKEFGCVNTMSNGVRYWRGINLRDSGEQNL